MRTPSSKNLSMFNTVSGNISRKLKTQVETLIRVRNFLNGISCSDSSYCFKNQGWH